MKTKIFLFVQVLMLVSCISKNEFSNSFTNKRTIGKKRYEFKDFTKINKEDLEGGSEVWFSMNYSNFEIAVFKENGQIRFADSNYEKSYFFELEDEKLQVINRGEFGGEFSFISNKDSSKQIIYQGNVPFIFSFKNRIYISMGIAHLEDSGGVIMELIRDGNKFNYEEVLKLDSAPEAVSIFEDIILVAGHSNFTVIKDFQKQVLVKDAFWGGGLYSNSIEGINEDEVYIGMRGGYAKLSLNSGKIDYYKKCLVLK